MAITCKTCKFYEVCLEDNFAEVSKNKPCRAWTEKMSKIKGLDLRAKDMAGNEIEHFKVGFIGNLAFGINNDNSTDKEFLELYVKYDIKDLIEAVSNTGNVR